VADKNVRYVFSLEVENDDLVALSSFCGFINKGLFGNCWYGRVPSFVF